MQARRQTLTTRVEPALFERAQRLAGPRGLNSFVIAAVESECTRRERLRAQRVSEEIAATRLKKDFPATAAMLSRLEEADAKVARLRRDIARLRARERAVRGGAS